MVQNTGVGTMRLRRDDRLGGEPYYVCSSDDHEFMLIHDDIKKCVCFVLYKPAIADPPKAGGTAFLAGIQDEAVAGFVYAITARHVIEHIQKDSSDDKVLLRINLESGGFTLVETKVQDWLFHPDDEMVDVAVMPMPTPPGYDVRVYNLRPDRIAGPETIVGEGIGPGDEVFIMGLFRSHYGKERNIPVARIGNIAAMPEEKVKVKWKDASIDAYLIEARSIGGLSGSPVFVHSGPVRWRDGKIMLADQRGGTWWLLGLMHGHFNMRVPDVDVAEDGLNSYEVNAGLAIVIPVTKIMEVINQQKLLEKRQEIIAKITRDKAAEPDLS